MSYYIHQSAGRIRIKVPSLKNQEYKATLLHNVLMRQTGVEKVNCNTVTGSVTVFYDSDHLLPSEIINLFNSLDLLPNVRGFPKKYAAKSRNRSEHFAEAMQSEWVTEISRFLIKAMLDKALSQTGSFIARKIL